MTGIPRAGWNLPHGVTQHDIDRAAGVECDADDYLCRICRERDGDGYAWDDDGTAVRACSLHAGAERIDGRWVRRCVCGKPTDDPSDHYCSDECYSLRFAAHRPV